MIESLIVSPFPSHSHHFLHFFLVFFLIIPDSISPIVSRHFSKSRFSLQILLGFSTLLERFSNLSPPLPAAMVNVHSIVTSPFIIPAAPAASSILDHSHTTAELLSILLSRVDSDANGIALWILDFNDHLARNDDLEEANGIREKDWKILLQLAGDQALFESNSRVFVRVWDVLRRSVTAEFASAVMIQRNFLDVVVTPPFTLSISPSHLPSSISIILDHSSFLPFLSLTLEFIHSNGITSL